MGGPIERCSVPYSNRTCIIMRRARIAVYLTGLQIAIFVNVFRPILWKGGRKSFYCNPHESFVDIGIKSEVLTGALAATEGKTAQKYQATPSHMLEHPPHRLRFQFSRAAAAPLIRPASRQLSRPHQQKRQPLLQHLQTAGSFRTTAALKQRPDYDAQRLWPCSRLLQTLTCWQQTSAPHCLPPIGRFEPAKKRMKKIIVNPITNIIPPLQK